MPRALPARIAFGVSAQVVLEQRSWGPRGATTVDDKAFAIADMRAAYFCGRDATISGTWQSSFKLHFLLGCDTDIYFVA